MNKKLVATLTLASFSQMACYNSYFIDKSELEKLESTVEPEEVVEVYGDCPTSGGTASIFEMGPVYAQAEGGEETEGSVDDDVMSEIEAITGEEGDTATDATDTGEQADKGDQKADGKKKKKGDKLAAKPMPADRAGCTAVQVSAANALQVVTAEGDQRVTPFNFIMSGGQLVSPEYDLLVPLSQVEGAKVREFSTFKTVATVVGVSAVALGTFIGISILAPESGGFQP